MATWYERNLQRKRKPQDRTPLYRSNLGSCDLDPRGTRQLWLRPYHPGPRGASHGPVGDSPCRPEAAGDGVPAAIRPRRSPCLALSTMWPRRRQRSRLQ